MDSFNEDRLLAKEWLVKVDAHASTPYLMKFNTSPVDLTCCIMVTDTKQTWVEALSSKQFARRWRECNVRLDSPPLDDEQEDAWRTRCLDVLSSAHTLGGILDLSFEVVESKFGDVAFQLECSAFKWRWDTVFVGHKVSADTLSKHLIMPLISANHLAFSSPDVVGDLPPTDLEKAVDKVARTARRTFDTHVKNALSKPRLATTLRRITAILNFISAPPNISTEADTPVPVAPRVPTPKLDRTRTPEQNDRRDTTLTSSSDAPSRKPSPINHAAESGSATEPEDDAPIQPPGRSGSDAGTADHPRHDVRMRSPTPSKGGGGASSRPGTSRSRSVAKVPSDTDSSPVRPIKKAKPRVASSDEDSEEERRRRVSQIRRGGTALGGVLRQPIKRGGKRF